MTQALAIQDDMPLMDLGNVLAKSGYFTDAKDAAQAIVKVLAGREMGFGPIASMTGIYIVKGKPSMGANLIAAAVKRSGRYDYRVKEHTDKTCTIEFYERVDGKREMIGVSTFTIEDARKAQTQNLEKFPRNMLFARAMSNGAKWYCADVFGGPVYTPDELGATVDGETGEVIDHGLKWSSVTSSVPPIEQRQPDTLDELTATAQRDAVTNTTATPAPQAEKPERKPYQKAYVKFNGLTATEWHARADAFAAKNTNWQSGGAANLNHILVSAGHAGYEVINGSNIDEVFAAIIAAHEAKAQP